MNFHTISPLDNRYWSQVSTLSTYFSEFALIKYKVRLEIDYFIMVAKINDENTKNYLYQLGHQFSDVDASDIKSIENITKHDIKAIEYWLRKKLENCNVNIELIHFGLTSEDVTNVSYRLAVKDYIELTWANTIKQLLILMKSLVFNTKYSGMIGRTHGQSATPTTLGKEIAVYLNRMLEPIRTIKMFRLKAKMNGAVGNWAAMYLLNNVNWYQEIKNLLNSYGLDIEYTTTQIMPYDNLNLLFNAFVNLNNVLIDFSQNMWRYISDDYLKLKAIEGEVGSSTIPHKVNPINFENAEGNLGLSNAIFNHMIDKLSKSRLQRDLSDSTVMRNVGVVFAHHHLSLQNIISCLPKLIPNNVKMKDDVANHPEIHSEMIQIMLKINGYKDGYEKVKDFFRGKGKKIDEIRSFISNLTISNETKLLILSNIESCYCGTTEGIIDSVLTSTDCIINTL